MATTNIEISFSKIFRENSLFTVSLIFCLFYQTYPMCSARSLIISRFERPAPILSSSWPTISSPFLQPWYPFFSSPFTSLVGASSLALFAALMLRSFRWWNLLRPRISNLPRAKQRRIFTFTFFWVDVFESHETNLHVPVYQVTAVFRVIHPSLICLDIERLVKYPRNISLSHFLHQEHK